MKNDNTALSLITSSVNCSTAPPHNEREGLAQNATAHCLQGTHRRCEDIGKLAARGQEKMLNANGNLKSSAVAVINIGEIKFTSKTVTRHKDIK